VTRRGLFITIAAARTAIPAFASLNSPIETPFSIPLSVDYCCHPTDRKTKIHHHWL
jgi:hypothetical protein